MVDCGLYWQPSRVCMDDLEKYIELLICAWWKTVLNLEATISKSDMVTLSFNTLTLVFIYDDHWFKCSCKSFEFRPWLNMQTIKISSCKLAEQGRKVLYAAKSSLQHTDVVCGTVGFFSRRLQVHFIPRHGAFLAVLGVLLFANSRNGWKSILTCSDFSWASAREARQQSTMGKKNW